MKSHHSYNHSFNAESGTICSRLPTIETSGTGWCDVHVVPTTRNLITKTILRDADHAGGSVGQHHDKNITARRLG